MKKAFDLTLTLLGIFVGGLTAASATTPETFHPWTYFFGLFMAFGIAVLATPGIKFYDETK